WIHWWSSTASANVFTRSCVISNQSVKPRSRPSSEVISAYGTTVCVVICGPSMELSDESRLVGERPADDEGVDLVGAFVGVHGFCVGEEPCGAVLEEQAVAAEEFTAEGDGLARPLG